MDNTELCHDIFMRLRTNQWWLAALQLEDQAKSPTVELSRSLLEDIQALLDDGRAAGIPTDDPIFKRIVTSYDRVIQWKNEAENVLSKLRSMTDRSSATWFLGSMAIKDLIKRGEQLEWPAPEDVQVLKDNSSLYCLCRTLPDEGSAMIQCDSCEEWFHFECVGRQAPALVAEEDDAMSWNCPICSFAVDVEYIPEKAIPKEPQATLHAIKECLPHLSPEFGPDLYKAILSVFNSAPFQSLFRPDEVPKTVLSLPENQVISEKLERVRLPDSFYTLMNPALWPSEHAGDAPQEIPSDDHPREDQAKIEKIELKDEDQILHIDDDEEMEPYWNPPT